MTIRNKGAYHQLLAVDSIKKWIDSERPLVIFEISKKEKYDEGHLPNAMHLWRPDYENKIDYPYDGMKASKAQMEVLFSQKGVPPDADIVLYDTKGSADAMRVYWILSLYGYQKVVVMNGGKTAWQQAAYPLSKQKPAPLPPSNFVFPSHPATIKIATLADVQFAIQDTNTIILDTREPAEFHGQPYIDKGKLYPYKKGAHINGCIPTAQYINWSDAVDLNGNHCFKSLKDLRYNFEKIGVLPHKKIITYCQSGVRSAHTAYVLSEILNYPQVANYDGSWIEWSYYHVNGKEVAIEQHTSATEFDFLYRTLEEKLAKNHHLK